MQEADAPEAPVATAAPALVLDRFGEPDEIDTTPRDEPTVVPNTASKPSWSFDEPPEIDTTPKDPAEPAIASSDAAPAEPDGPPKKGWWQRAFRS
ncbi:MAG TPA: hypothetical protein VGB91_02575 [Rhizomicrobium sp.]